MSTFAFRRDALELIAQWERMVTSVPPPGCHEIAAGPFRLYVHPELRDDHLNVAFVAGDPGKGETGRRAVGELAAAFDSVGRSLNIEFNGARWPGLGRLLEAAGVARRAAHPLMACAPGMLRPAEVPGLTLARLRPDSPESDLLLFATIRSTSGTMSPPPGAWVLERLRESARRRSSVHLLARLEGRAAGTGVLHDTLGVAEIVGIVTVEAERRRGVAGAVTSRLASEHFAAGGRLCFLDAEDARAESVYRRIGFETIGEWLFYGAGSED